MTVTSDRPFAGGRQRRLTATAFTDWRFVSAIRGIPDENGTSGNNICIHRRVCLAGNRVGCPVLSKIIVTLFGSH